MVVVIIAIVIIAIVDTLLRHLIWALAMLATVLLRSFGVDPSWLALSESSFCREDFEPNLRTLHPSIQNPKSQALEPSKTLNPKR